MTAARDARQATILLHVQHLLGVGHVFRARRLAEGLTAVGIDVEIAFGGTPLPDMRFDARAVHRLPPIRAGKRDFSVIHDGSGKPLTAEYQSRRAERLVRIFDEVRPDLVLIEQFPFGRRVLKPEMEALFAAAERRPRRPIFACSVRDILQEGRKPGRSQETADLVRRHFDFVLVHSDPALIRLEETFPIAGTIADKLRYTGIVATPPNADTQAVERFDVIVSVGGGAFGAELLRVACATARAMPAELRWCLVTGPNRDDSVARDLAAGVGANMTVRTFLPDFRTWLEQATVSVSQAGYNTVADVLAAGCRAVLVPFDRDGQTEQLRRAQLLERAGRTVTVPQTAATPKRLAEAVNAAMAMPRPATHYNLDGVGNSVATIRAALDARTAANP